MQSLLFLINLLFSSNSTVSSVVITNTTNVEIDRIIRLDGHKLGVFGILGVISYCCCSCEYLKIRTA